MRIKIWGSRGSIATPGQETMKYGGNTSCVQVILSDGTIIIFDAGSGIRKLGKEIENTPTITEMYLFFTHAHWDHINGFPFFTPAYSDKYKIHIRGGLNAKEVLKSYIGDQMKAPYFPVSTGYLKTEFVFTNGTPREQNIKKASITPISLNHPNGGFGYKIEEKGKVFVFIPDNELDGKEFKYGESFYTYSKFIENADLVIHDAQYTPNEFEKKKGWGHSSFISTINLGISSNVKRLGLFHHDPDRTDKQLDKIGILGSEIVKKKNSIMECIVAYDGQEIIL